MGQAVRGHGRYDGPRHGFSAGSAVSAFNLIGSHSEIAGPIREIGEEISDGRYMRGAMSRYNETVITRGIREFMARDWRAVREAKDAYWGARVARLGPREGFRIADELRRQAILQHASWPWPADRREDLLAHVRLSECFHRAGSTRRR